MRFQEIVEYIGGRTVVQDISGQFADLALISQLTETGIVVIRQGDDEVAIAYDNAVPTRSAQISETTILPLEFDSWPDIPINPDATVSLSEVQPTLSHVLFGTTPDPNALSNIAAQIPLSLAIKLIESKAKYGTYLLSTEEGSLLLQIDGTDRERAVWVSPNALLTGSEALNLAQTVYGNTPAAADEVIGLSETEPTEDAQTLLDAAQRIWLEEKDVTKAVDMAKQAVPLLPKEARTLMARIYGGEGQTDDAIAQLEILIRQGRADEDTYGRLARRFEEQDRLTDAVKLLQSAATQPGIDDLQIMRSLVALYTKRQMITELIVTLDEIISRSEIASDDTSRETLHWAMHRKGLALRTKGNPRQASVLLERAIELDPEDISPYQDLASSYRELGNPRDAVTVLEQALEYAADAEAVVKVHHSLAILHMSLQQYQRAAESYQQILALDETNLGALLQLGQINIRLDDIEEARACFLKALAANPENSTAQDFLAKLANGSTKKQIRTSAPRDEVRLREELDTEALISLLHSRVKRELDATQNGLSSTPQEPAADGWAQYYDCIKKGTNLRIRTECYQQVALIAQDNNEPALFALAAAQYCQVKGYFEFRYRGDHQAARHVYYRSLVRLLRQMAGVPKSMASVYRSVINAYLYSCRGLRNTPQPQQTDAIIGDILANPIATRNLQDEIGFWAEENPSLLLEVANWLNLNKQEFLTLCAAAIKELATTKPYEAFSALIRLDRELAYFRDIAQHMKADQTGYLAQAIVDFLGSTTSSKTERVSKIEEQLVKTDWSDEARQAFALEIICYKRADTAMGLQNQRRSLLRTVLQLKKRRGEEIFLEKALDIGNTLARFWTAQTPQDKYLYGKQTETELQKATGYIQNLQYGRRGLAGSLLSSIRTATREGIAEISLYPEIDLELTTSRLPYSEEVSLYFTVRNIGFGPAEDVRLTVLATDNFAVSLLPAAISVLSAGRDTTWEVAIRPPISSGELTLTATVSWRNVQKHEESRDFEFVATFYPIEEFRRIPKRYIPGKPIQDPAMFYGREGILEEIVDNLKGISQDNVLVLYGQRRVGKTSLLYRLQTYDLRGLYVPVFVDMQELSGSSTARLCSKLANSVLNALISKGVSAPAEGPLPSTYFEHDPLGKLGEFFDQVDVIPGIRVLLLIDEFEALMLSINEGSVTEHFYSFLRGLMQHKSKISFVFAGADELQNMMRDYASIMFNIARFIPVGYMSSEEAQYLIEKPVEGFLTYDEAAVDRIITATAGNPYYIQLICFELVERMNREKRNNATVVDVNEVIKELLRFGSSYFEHLWRRSEPLENILLACLAELADPSNNRWASYHDILERMRQLGERHSTELPLAQEGVLLKVTKTLRDRGVVEERRHEEEMDYRIHVDLFRQWFSIYQPLERTIKEMLADVESL